MGQSVLITCRQNGGLEYTTFTWRPEYASTRLRSVYDFLKHLKTIGYSVVECQIGGRPHANDNNP